MQRYKKKVKEQRKITKLTLLVIDPKEIMPQKMIETNHITGY